MNIWMQLHRQVPKSYDGVAALEGLCGCYYQMYCIVLCITYAMHAASQTASVFCAILMMQHTKPSTIGH